MIPTLTPFESQAGSDDLEAVLRKRRKMAQKAAGAGGGGGDGDSDTSDSDSESEEDKDRPLSPLSDSDDEVGVDGKKAKKKKKGKGDKKDEYGEEGEGGGQEGLRTEFFFALLCTRLTMCRTSIQVCLTIRAHGKRTSVSCRVLRIRSSVWYTKVRSPIFLLCPVRVSRRLSRPYAEGVPQQVIDERGLVVFSMLAHCPAQRVRSICMQAAASYRDSYVHEEEHHPFVAFNTTRGFSTRRDDDDVQSSSHPTASTSSANNQRQGEAVVSDYDEEQAAKIVTFTDLWCTVHAPTAQKQRLALAVMYDAVMRGFLSLSLSLSFFFVVNILSLSLSHPLFHHRPL